MAKIIKSAKGSFTAASITVDGSGRVVTASSGAGAANMKNVLIKSGPASGTYTADPSATKFQAYLFGGGGGGGGGNNQRVGGTGGQGGSGFYAGSVSGGTGYSYAIGGGGGGGASGYTNASSGSSGGATNITNLATVNGGGGGGGAQGQSNGSSGQGGSATGADHTDVVAGALLGNRDISSGASGGQAGYHAQNPPQGINGSSAAGGGLVIFENDG